MLKENGTTHSTLVCVSSIRYGEKTIHVQEKNPNPVRTGKLKKKKESIFFFFWFIVEFSSGGRWQRKAHY